MGRMGATAARDGQGGRTERREAAGLAAIASEGGGRHGEGAGSGRGRAEAEQRRRR